jgi:phage shock protein PspC (stress-responsive transcriptional regulator)
MGNNREKNKKDITTIVLVSLALFIYMLILGTFLSIRSSGILPGAIGITLGFIIFYVTFGGKYERALTIIIAPIGIGFAIAGLLVGIANYLKIEVTLLMFIIFLIVGICLSVALFRLLEKKTDRKKVEMAYKTDERGILLNEKSATFGFIALSVFLLAYLIKGYLEAGIFDKILLLTLCGGWLVLIFARLYYEWRM